MDGGDLAVTNTDPAVTVWRRTNEIYTAAAGGAERKLGIGKDPSLAVTTQGTYAAWNSPEALVLLRPGAEKPVTLDPAGRFVQLLNVSGKVIAVWERQGAVVIEPL